MRRTLITMAAVLATNCSSPTPGPSTPSAAPPPSSVTVTPLPPAPPPVVVRGPNFDQSFWNQFVHDGFDAPPGTMPLRRLLAAPMMALMTIDDVGQPIDSGTLSSTESALRDVAPQWTGGVFGLAGVQRVTQSMEGQRGWLTVTWVSTASALCGRSDVGLDGGVIELYPNTPGCGCPGGVTTSRIRPRTVAHELGHAFGYWHTDNSADLMHTPSSACVQAPSDRERYHAEIAYRSPVGTVDRRGGPLIVVD